MVHRLIELARIQAWVLIRVLMGPLERTRNAMISLWRYNIWGILQSSSLRKLLHLEIWVGPILNFLNNLVLILIHHWTQIWIILVIWLPIEALGCIFEKFNCLSIILIPRFELSITLIVIKSLFHHRILGRCYLSHSFLMEHGGPIIIQRIHSRIDSEVVPKWTFLWAQKVWSSSDLSLRLRHVLLRG